MSNPAKCDSVKFRLYAREVEERFCKVYRNVICNFFSFKEDLISDAKLMLNSKKERKKVNSDLPSYQLGFLLSFGVQDTCLSARKFFESIINEPKMIQKLSNNSLIKLLCLESESLPTVIGVCQVINEIVKEFGPRGKFYFTEIRIVVIDNRENWKHLCGCVIDTANSYFTKVELKLDSVEDFMSWSFQEFNERIRELDFFVIARFFAEDRTFNYNFIRIILNEMKDDAILFYFDSCNRKFYNNLKEISKSQSFSQVKNCQNLLASFEDLGDEQYYLDLPVSWDKDFQPIMFSIWVKNFIIQNNSFPEDVKPNTSNELNKIKCKNESDNLEMLTLNMHISNSKTTETFTSGQTNVIVEKKKEKNFTKQCSESDTLLGKTKIVIDKEKINDVAEQCNDFNTPSEQVNLANVKKKIKSKKRLAQSNSPNFHANVISETKVVKTLTKHCSQSDSPSKQINIISAKKEAKSLTKHSYPDISTTETNKSKDKKVSNTQKTHEILDTVLSILNKEALGNRTTNQSQTSQCSNVACDPAISQKVRAKIENQATSVKELSIESSMPCTTKIIKSEGKGKAGASKISTSTSKITITNQSDQTFITKQTGSGNVPTSVLTASVSKKKKPSEIKSKSTTNLESIATKESKKKSVDKQLPATTATPKDETEKTFLFNLPKKSHQKNTAKTKKTNKNNATEKVKLKGKFAYMDLEKKNKDERHKMKAKKASFAKHANFDYDD